MALLETDQAAREMTGFTEMELAEYKYDTGLAYLRAAVKCPSAFAYLEGSKEYWNWWRNQWELRDADQAAHHFVGGNACDGLLITRAVGV